MEYQKPTLKYEEQLHLLVKRGLQTNHPDVAIHHLKHISYYRLSAYFIPFKTDDQFKIGTSFEEIMQLYNFDQALRTLVLQGIGPIEVSLRTHLAYHFSHHYGAFGYLEPTNFHPRLQHQRWIEDLRKTIRDSNEVFIQHYRQKYTASADLPLWGGGRIGEKTDLRKKNLIKSMI